MGDTKTEGIQDNSDTLKKEKENDSLPNGNGTYYCFYEINWRYFKFLFFN